MGVITAEAWAREVETITRQVLSECVLPEVKRQVERLVTDEILERCLRYVQVGRRPVELDLRAMDRQQRLYDECKAVIVESRSTLFSRSFDTSDPDGVDAAATWLCETIERVLERL